MKVPITMMKKKMMMITAPDEVFLRDVAVAQMKRKNILPTSETASRHTKSQNFCLEFGMRKLKVLIPRFSSVGS